MKAYMILNIVSIILLVIAFSGFALGGTNFFYNSDRFRAYYEEQEAKGKNGDEILESFNKRESLIGDVIETVTVLSFIIPFVLSIISVCLKPNFIGIILLVISTICVLLGLYIYMMGKGY